MKEIRKFQVEGKNITITYDQSVAKPIEIEIRRKGYFAHNLWLSKKTAEELIDTLQKVLKEL